MKMQIAKQEITQDPIQPTNITALRNRVPGPKGPTHQIGGAIGERNVVIDWDYLALRNRVMLYIRKGVVPNQRQWP